MNSIAERLAVLLLAATACQAQLGAWPSWANDSFLIDVPLTAHPALSGVRSGWYGNRLEKTPHWETVPGPFQVAWHPLHGNVAVRQVSSTASTELGALDPGLAYVFCLLRLGTRRAPLGIAVCGLTSQGRSRVRYMAWDGSAAPSNTWVTLASATSTQERWLVASVLDGDLVLFEGASERVKRFDDTDSDGIPDASTPSLDVPVNRATPGGDIDSFYKSHSGELCVRYGLTSWRDRWTVTSGGLVFIRGDASGAVAGLRGYRPCGGLRVLRVSFRTQSKCKILDSSQRAISSSHPTGGAAQVDIPLWRPLVPGETIHIWGQKNNESPTLSNGIVVLPSAMTAFPAARIVYDDHSEKIKILGGNWPSTLTMTGAFDHAPLATIAWQKVDSNTLIVTPRSTSPGGPPRTFVLRLKPSPTSALEIVRRYLIVDQL